MRVGILTFQNTTNFGAALQSYALFRTIELMGIKVELIDYRNEKITNNRKIISVATNRGKKKLNLIILIKAIIMYPLIKSKQNAFDTFDKKYFSFSQKSYHSKQEINIDPPVYDKYIIGSDQVWNYNINGLDTTYFMDFVNDKSKIFSYASSFGLDEISEEYGLVYKEELNKIEKISVREKSGGELIKKLTDRDVEIMPDPVFLFSEDEWLKIFNIQYQYKNNQIVSYFLNHNTRKQCEDILNSDNQFKDSVVIKLAGGIAISDFLSKKKIVKFSNGPIDFIKHIKESEYIFTDSFHATVFSIIFKKNFIVFLSGNVGRDSRIIDLLKIFKQEDRIYDKEGKTTYKKEINKEEIDYIKNSLKQNGIKFLKENLFNN